MIGVNYAANLGQSILASFNIAVLAKYDMLKEFESFKHSSINREVSHKIFLST